MWSILHPNTYASFVGKKTSLYISTCQLQCRGDHNFKSREVMWPLQYDLTCKRRGGNTRSISSTIASRSNRKSGCAHIVRPVTDRLLCTPYGLHCMMKPTPWPRQQSAVSFLLLFPCTSANVCEKMQQDQIPYLAYIHRHPSGRIRM